MWKHSGAKRDWNRYLEAVRQGAGESPAPSPAQVKERPGRPCRAGRFARTTGRGVLAALRALAGLAEFGLWAGLNLIIALAVLLAARASGADLPPWLDWLAGAIQHMLDHILALARLL